MKRLSQIITDIESFGITTRSHIFAIEDFLNLKERDQEYYEEQIFNLMDLDERPRYNNMRTAKGYFAYCIQESVRLFNTKGNTISSTMDVWELAQIEMKRFVLESPWAVKDYDAAESDNPNAGVSKKDMAIALYATMVKENKNLLPSRKDAIALFVEKLGMTPAGASTYVANCKKGYP